MPYFRNDKRNINLLYIHIPKTGGSTIEKYFSKKYRKNRGLTLKNLYSGNIFNRLSGLFYGSPQHQSLRTLMRFRRRLGISRKNLKIIASVRNPYTRTISDLFHFKLINHKSTQKQVFNVLCRYVFVRQGYDNHNLPQYTFIINNKGKIPKNAKIIKNENLNEDMANIGYKGLETIRKRKVGKSHKKNYYNYLNKDSINLINKVYNKDFELFCYDKITNS